MKTNGFFASPAAASLRVRNGDLEVEVAKLRAATFERDGESAEQAAARPDLRMETGGFAASELISVAFGAPFSMSVGARARTWAIEAEGLQYPQDLGDGDCQPAERCTQAQVVAMQHNEQGALEVRLDGNGAPQVLREADEGARPGRHHR